MPTTDKNHFSGFDFINSYASLPPDFYTYVKPTPVCAPQIIKINEQLASELKLDASTLTSIEGAEIFSGNRILSSSKPLAQVYAGHQFGQFNPRLGDGRAILLGDIVDINNQLRDIQLKGSGPTPYSRGGDGRAALGPVIREYVISEAMYALGIKTTRSLAAVTTGESVYRQTVQKGAVITRVASSHVRIGTFEYFRSQNAVQSIKELADFVIGRHYPEARYASKPYVELLKLVIDTQASLVASWMHVGFIHGVMNTDNMSICGETIDYGPCAFMNDYNPRTVFSSIDHAGRYSYGNQANIALWNLTRFAECLLPLFDDDIEAAIQQAELCLAEYSILYKNYWLKGMLAKLGIFASKESDESLVQSLLQEMTKYNIDFTQFFRALSSSLDQENLFYPDMQDWFAEWRSRVAEQAISLAEIGVRMNQTNPIYIPRNHIVEEAISAAEDDNDFRPMEKLISVLSSPYDKQVGMERYEMPPPPSDRPYKTFCGT